MIWYYIKSSGNLISQQGFTYYRIVRKYGDFAIQHAGTGIKWKVHANNIQLARGQTEWNTDPTWVRGRKAKHVYYPTYTDERESTNDPSVTPELSITHTDSGDQPLAKFKKKVEAKI